MKTVQCSLISAAYVTPLRVNRGLGMGDEKLVVGAR